MQSKTAIPKKQSSRKYIWIYVGALFFHVIITSCLSCGLVAGILTHDVFLAVWSISWLIFGTWAFGAWYLSIPLTLYLNSLYGKHDFARIDVTYVRMASLLNKLPVRKTADMAILLSNLALMRLCQGYFDSAESLFRQALSLIEKNKNFARHITFAILLNNLACACIKQQKYLEAQLHATRAQEILEYSKNTQYKCLLAWPLAALGTVHWKLGEWDKAAEYLDKACEIQKNTKPFITLLPDSVSQSQTLCYLGLALVYAKQNHWVESEDYWEQIYKHVQENSAAINTQAIEGLNLLANEYMNTQRFEQAEQILELAYSLGKNYPMHPDARQTLNYFEKLLLLSGRQAEVEDMRHWLRSAAVRCC